MNEPVNNTNSPRFQAIGRGNWIDSLRDQWREAAEARKNPRPPVELTAKADPQALGKLVSTASPVESLFIQIRASIDDLLHPKERFVPSAEPVNVDNSWSQRDLRRPGLISVAAHLVVIALLVVPFFGIDDTPLQLTETVVPLYTPLTLELPPMDELSGGGGGGGLQQEEPPSLGEIPEAAAEQFVPPSVVPPSNPNPLLVMAPTVIAPQLANPDRIVDLAMLGAEDGIPGPPSAGPGIGGGIGTGQGTGVGEGIGAGVGEGEGGGFGGGVFRIGGGVSPPSVVSQVQPEYSEEARKARYQGVVVLEAIVHPDGSVEIIRVVRSLGFGLDEKAIEALQQWKFRPGMRGGEPVPVALNIEVNFNLR
jgi:TonB family protein